jgi:pyruvate/2-oxoglutarate dehydrogenase complex dihydrolipoamide acyltransferase (E2) component
MRHNPTIRISTSGTVFVTTVGMFAKGHSGWGVTATPHSLNLVVGSIVWKPTIVEGRIEPREILNLTVLFDHDVVDGAPATRFVRRLLELIETGYGLDQMGEQPSY